MEEGRRLEVGVRRRRKIQTQSPAMCPIAGDCATRVQKNVEVFVLVPLSQVMATSQFENFGIAGKITRS